MHGRFVFNRCMKRFRFDLLCACFCIVLSLESAAAADASPLAAWTGEWDGELNVYSATGDRIETFHVAISSSADPVHGKGLQKISMRMRSSKEVDEKQNGLLMSGASGMRRVMKGEKGETVSDLRGRLIGPSKFYWFSVDTDGVLREAYIETIEGETARVNGFRWDGKRSGSYRIIEGVYQRAKPK